MRPLTLIAATLLVACSTSADGDDDDSAVEEPTPAPPTAVDEACQDITDPGDAGASEAEIDGLVRLNCYRRLAGLAEVRMDPLLNAAARAHANYIDVNDAYGHQESDSNAAGFTGEWVADRVAAAGYVYDAIDTNIEEVVSFASTGADAAGAIDLWIDSVYHRTPLLRPSLVAVGVGQARDFDVLVIASPWEPAGDLSRSSLPTDGQFGVPVAFDSDTESPDPSPLGVVGYPISVSVQGPWSGSFDDPHGLRLEPASTITGPEGAVSYAILDPSTDATLREDAFLLPDQPLSADTSYDVVLQGTAGGTPFTIEATFETAP